MAGSWTAPSMRPAARSSPRKSTSKHLWFWSSSCTVSGSKFSTFSTVGTMLGRFTGAQPGVAATGPDAASGAAGTGGFGAAPGMQNPPPGTPARHPSTNLCPSCNATSSAFFAFSLSAGMATGRPTASQPRKPPESIPTRCRGPVFSRYQFAHCGARCAEYWQKNTTSGRSAHCSTSSGHRPRKPPTPAAGTCSAPSMRPAIRSSPRRSTRRHFSSLRRLRTASGVRCSTFGMVATRCGQYGGTYTWGSSCADCPGASPTTTSTATGTCFRARFPSDLNGWAPTGKANCGGNAWTLWLGIACTVPSEFVDPGGSSTTCEPSGPNAAACTCAGGT
mmetsp:Transcript_131045/g.355644  ORF Transcript_131045/g.355644 Transcript_131045/m.355644 type:complete len:334 (+) Transcript_131045:581-1582(+)